MYSIMNHHCKTCNLDFTTSSNLRKHERTEKHLTKCQLLTMVEPTTSDQKIKELEEKLAKAEQTILLQTQLIQSYQVIVLLTGLPDPMLPEVKLSEVKLEVAPDVPEKPPKKVKKSKPVPEVVAEPEVVAAPEVVAVPEVVAAPEVVAESEVVAAPEVVGIPTFDKETKELQKMWKNYETLYDFDTTKSMVEAYKPTTRDLKIFKDQYQRLLMQHKNGYVDRRPLHLRGSTTPVPEPVVSEPVPEPVVSEPVPEPEVVVVSEVVVSEPKPVKLKKVKKVKTEEEQAEEDKNDMENMRDMWDEYTTRLSFQEIQQQIESYQPRNEALQKFKDSYYARFMNDGYIDRRPKEEPKPEKPRRKLKIINDPPKDLEQEIFKPETKLEPEPVQEKPRRKLKIINDPPKSIS